MPFRVLPLTRTSNELDGRKSLLITRLDGIGDFVIFLDAFKEYRKLYPPEEWEITLLGNRAYRVLAENLTYADRYWFMDMNRFKRNPVYRYRLLSQVRRAMFDVVIHPNYSRGYWLGDAIVRASAAPERIGSECDFTNISHRQKPRSDRWYTRLIPAEPGNIMELERNAQFICGLGLSDFQAGLPRLAIPDDAQKRADAMLERIGLLKLSNQKSVDFYILFPGAGSKSRQWPVEHFAELARRIYDLSGWAGLVCGGPGDKVLAGELIELAGNIPLASLAGKTDLMEFAAVVKRSRLLIGNETGAVQIASAVGTPSVCILGGGHFGRFVPYSVPNGIHAVYREVHCFGCNWECVHQIDRHQAVDCIQQVEVHQVMESIAHEVALDGECYDTCFQ